MESYDEDDTDLLPLGFSKDVFSDKEVVNQMIQELPNLKENEVESYRQKISLIFSSYQSEPHVLDPHLDVLLSSLLLHIKGPVLKNKIEASYVTVNLIKVRGYKTIIKFLPHEVSDLESTLELLESQDTLDHDSWPLRYLLLLWLAILVMIPFDMRRFDSQNSSSTLFSRIISMISVYLKGLDKCQDGAGFLAAKFYTRPDVQVANALQSFVESSLKTFQESSEHSILGSLKALAAIFKIGNRDECRLFASSLLKGLQTLKNSENALIRRFGIKLLNRIGLTFLKAKVASWRYQRGTRSLQFNLQGQSKIKGQDETKEKEEEKDSEDDFDIPDEIEDVIQELFLGLKDKETVIRWSAAKGLGRITSRLPRDLADDVIDTLLDYFSFRENDSTWHGACLAVAELSRRGLLLPSRLSQLLPLLESALVYDERRGCYSVGSHVRDAACYVAWAIGRAYHPEVLRPYVFSLSTTLMVVTCFDREVMCRRAASAAFQENVGRQGTFPHGIDILTEADYFTVGNRNLTYTKTSVFVASFPEYTKPLILHLIDKKIDHWDINIRELTAESLRNLAPLAPTLMVDEILPRLLLNVNSKSGDLYLKHGSICALGDICLGLVKTGKLSLPLELMSRIKDCPLLLVQSTALSLSGGEFLRAALSSLIGKISQAHFPISETDIDFWQLLLNENIAYANTNVQHKTIEALPYFMNEYFRQLDGSVHENKRNTMVKDYISQMDKSESSRRSFSLALGSFPKDMLLGQLDVILQVLVEGAKMTSSTESWAEARRDSMKAIISIVKTLGVVEGYEGENSVCEANVVMLYECFLNGLKDYTTERRGDVGAWVREAGISGFEALIFNSVNSSVIPENCIRALMPELAGQAVEKIDRTRGLACYIFAKLIHHQPPLIGIPNHQEILNFFPKNYKDYTWTSESVSYPLFAKLLQFSPYRENILQGLIVAIGGLTLSLVKQASLSLYSELNILDVQYFAESIIKILHRSSGIDRIIIPFFNFIELVLNSGHLKSLLISNDEHDNSFGHQLFTCVKHELLRCGEPTKLIASINTFTALLQCEEKTKKKALVQLSIFLCHKFPRVRKVAATKLYEALLTYTDLSIVPNENLEPIMNLLSSTKWDQHSLEDLRPIRNNLCLLLNISPPIVIKKH